MLKAVNYKYKLNNISAHSDYDTPTLDKISICNCAPSLDVLESKLDHLLASVIKNPREGGWAKAWKDSQNQRNKEKSPNAFSFQYDGKWAFLFLFSFVSTLTASLIVWTFFLPQNFFPANTAFPLSLKTVLFHLSVYDASSFSPPSLDLYSYCSILLNSKFSGRRKLGPVMGAWI
jgi:hypothetical protein